MEPNNGGLEDDFPFQTGENLRFQPFEGAADTKPGGNWGIIHRSQVSHELAMMMGKNATFPYPPKNFQMWKLSIYFPILANLLFRVVPGGHWHFLLCWAWKDFAWSLFVKAIGATWRYSWEAATLMTAVFLYMACYSQFRSPTCECGED